MRDAHVRQHGAFGLEIGVQEKTPERSAIEFTRRREPRPLTDRDRRRPVVGRRPSETRRPAVCRERRLRRFVARQWRRRPINTQFER